jgi:hypothetical protein
MSGTVLRASRLYPAKLILITLKAREAESELRNSNLEPLNVERGITQTVLGANSVI